ncbi:hypothetical protein [Variovorax sp. J22R115]|uniref:hypothetical protein n=1 Tax=Variovorax sp. J22R115 TaxID=3053509 RepID=UPI002574A116|nr:hypothetical protein [Variovorax sp. J22R115]MDM0053028.1 hypothetical protein [Variovorax sp. J22R115]
MSIIFIEGIVGSGKSSTAHQLGLHLRKLGRTTQWYFEHDSHHPIYPAGHAPNYDCELSRGQQVDIRRSVLSRWKVLAESISRTKEVVILEGGFFQTVIDHFLLLNLGFEDAINHISEVESLVASLDPAMILLYQEDVDAALNRILSERSAAYADYLVNIYKQSPFGRAHGISGYPDVIEAIAATRQVRDAIFEKLRMRKLSIDNSLGDWRRYYDAITDFLALPPMNFPSDLPGKVEMLVGNYHSAESNAQFCVFALDNALYFSSEARLRLVPKSGSEFYLLGTRWWVTFETNDRGVAYALKLFGDESAPLEAWRQI